MKKMNSGIYYIVNTITNDYYIGKTKNFILRFKQHNQEALEGKTKSKLYKEIRKYGLVNFDFKIVARIAEDEIDEIEKFLLTRRNSKQIFKNNSFFPRKRKRETFIHTDCYYREYFFKPKENILSKEEKNVVFIWFKCLIQNNNIIFSEKYFKKCKNLFKEFNINSFEELETINFIKKENTNNLLLL